MATPLQRLCVRTRTSNQFLGVNASVLKPNTAARQFHDTQCRRIKKKAEEDEDLNRPFPGVGRAKKRPPIDISKIDAPRATSTHQYLRALTEFAENEELHKDEQNIEKYLTFVSQYGTAVSPTSPAKHDQLQRQHGIDGSATNIDFTDESQIDALAKRTEKTAEMALKDIQDLQRQNPGTIKLPVKRGKPGDQVRDPVFEGDDITALGHGYLEQHREIREYYRLAAWELPLLTQHAKPFELPAGTSPLRFRHTSYMGEQHPSEKKVVVEFCTADLPLTPYQRRKLVKLLGPRYNPQKDLAKMSCESFPDPHQNKRYLSDLVDTLLAEARLESDTEGAKDTFDDVPPDFRHVRWKKRPKFPDTWKMTPDRRAKLFQGWTAEIGRTQQMLLEGKTIDGEKTVAHFLGAQATAVAQPIKVR